MTLTVFRCYAAATGDWLQAGLRKARVTSKSQAATTFFGAPLTETKYLYYCRSDGIGFQYTFISQLLHISNLMGARLLVDWRGLSFLRFHNQSFEKSRLDKYLRIEHPLLIDEPNTIDEVLLKSPDEVLRVSLGKSHSIPGARANRVAVVDFDELCQSFGSGADWLCDYIAFVGNCRNTYDRYEPTVKQCTGVHARLGNGEVLKNPTMQQRMAIDAKRFFQEIDVTAVKQIFVCTDTPSFLSACTQRYGDRVKSLPRVMPHENTGPGHRPGNKSLEGAFDPYQLIADAFMEMLLLGESKFLICNKSLFTVHARHCKRVPYVMLDNGSLDYDYQSEGSENETG